MKRDVTFGQYFCGNKIGNYGIENGRVDYATLAKSFDAVLNNEIVNAGWNIGGGWELYNGDDGEDEDGNFPEVFQWYVISDAGASILEDYTDEIVYYHEDLDMYVWGVTHYGTSWDYVLTDIKCNSAE